MRQTIGMFSFLAIFNVAVWIAAVVAFRSHPLLLGTALLAYTFGLRHALDADHISAIDNVTRKLLQERRRPVAVGLYFSLGHSTVVIALSLAVAAGSSIIRANIPGLQTIGGLIGTSISALFLIVIAVVNMLVLAEIFRAFGRMRRGEPLTDRTLDESLPQRGFMGWLFRPLLRIVDKSWHMYPVGLLFGLGFDTATEVAVLGIAAIEGARGLPILYILIFPLLFTAGMSLIDTADGVLMLKAYGWALAKPVRKLHYNMTVTLISVLVALLVGGIEALGAIGARFDLTGTFWTTINGLSDNLSGLGVIIVSVFVVSWAISVLLYRLNRHDEFTPGGAKAKQIA
jgi:nickel/cobalt transporter (NiCoT) family protein